MNVKGGVFARYRSLCETLGGLLIESAVSNAMNVMIETSGKDIASFHYVNTFFNDEQYRKLVVNFTINDLTHAEYSVNQRMQQEMTRGCALVEQSTTTVHDLMSVNCGGPYGGSQLAAVETASKQTWQRVVGTAVHGGGGEGGGAVTTGGSKGGSNSSGRKEDPWSTWYKAHVEINGGKKTGGAGWSARAVGVVDGGVERKSEKYVTFDRSCVVGSATSNSSVVEENGAEIVHVEDAVGGSSLRPKKRVKRG